MIIVSILVFLQKTKKLPLTDCLKQIIKTNRSMGFNVRVSWASLYCHHAEPMLMNL